MKSDKLGSNDKSTTNEFDNRKVPNVISASNVL